MCSSGVRVMPYLYKVVLGVTGAEGSSEEKVEPLRSPPSPEKLVVLLRVQVELPLGITPGILREEEDPSKSGGSAGPTEPEKPEKPEKPTAVTSSSTIGCEVFLLLTVQLVHHPHPRGRLCFGCPMLPSSSPWAEPCRHGRCCRTLGAQHDRPVKYVTQH